MEFKIDTKDAFAVIIPLVNVLDGDLTAKLASKCAETRLNGSNNLIIDLQQVETIDGPSADQLVQLHEESYANNQSLVFTGLQAGPWATLKENETDLLLNIAPKMIEAVDIISMEMLERDLFAEE